MWLRSGLAAAATRREVSHSRRGWRGLSSVVHCRAAIHPWMRYSGRLTLEGQPFLRHSASAPELGATSTSFGALLGAGDKRRFFFIGGKGGVGKTTTAASLGVGLARVGRKTLVVSTDPAHSLGDALAMNLTGAPQPVPLEGPGWSNTSQQGSLHAMEIDPSKVIDEFRSNLNLDKLRVALSEQRAGLGAGFLHFLGKAGVDLNAIGALLDLSPPGIDEAVALAQLMHLLHDEEQYDFERIVIDTAPTGHTLRLLSFPQFLHGVIAALLSASQQMAGFAPVGILVNKVIGDDLNQQLKVSKANLERFMASMESLNTVLMDSEATSFIVVAIPTHLAVSESRRLLDALREAQMPARHLIMNQCPFTDLTPDGKNMLDEVQIAVEKLIACQMSVDVSDKEVQLLRQMVTRLQNQNIEAEKQIELLEQKAGPTVQFLRVPTFEEELTGVSALERYARVLFPA